VLVDATKQQQNTFENAVKAALGRLKSKKFSDCGKLFGGQAGIDALLGASYRYDTDPTLVAMPGAAAETDRANRSVTINLAGPFFAQVQTLSNGQKMDYGASLGLRGTDFRAFILLHELGHLTGVYGPTDNDGTNRDNQITNSTTVLKDCYGKDFNPNP